MANKVTIKIVTEGDAKAKATFQSLDRSADKVGGSMGKMGGQGISAFKGMAVAAVAMGAAMVATKIVSFMGDAISAASDLEQSIGGVEAIFGDAAGEILAFGETAADTVGLTKEQFNSLALITGSLLQNMGLNLEQATGATISLTERAADMAAVFGGPVSGALEAINSALKGENNPIEAYGVKLKAADVDARALAMGLAETKGALTDAHKAMAIMDLIMEQTANTTGQFAAEADTLAGQQERMRAEWGNMTAEIGAALMPAMQSLIQVFLDNKDVLVKLIEKFAEIMEKIMPLITGFFDLVSVGLEVIGFLLDAQSAANDFLDTMGPLGDALGIIVDPLGAVASGIGWIGDQLSGTNPEIDAMNEAWDDFDEIGRAADGDLADLGVTTGITGDAIEDLSDDLDDVEDSAEGATGAIKSLRDLQREMIDPVFKLSQAQERFDTALAKTWEDGIQTEAELRGLVPLFSDLKGAEEGMGSENIQAWNDVFDEMGDELGLLPGQIDGVKNSLGETNPVIDSIQTNMDELADHQYRLELKLDRDVAGFSATERAIARVTGRRNLRIHTRYTSTGRRPTAGRGSGGRTGGVTGFDMGGIVPGPRGEPRLILAHGGETIKSLSSSNSKKAGTVGTLGEGGGLNVYINVEGNVLSEGDFVETVRDELVKIQKRNGTTGLL